MLLGESPNYLDQTGGLSVKPDLQLPSTLQVSYHRLQSDDLDITQCKSLIGT